MKDIGLSNNFQNFLNSTTKNMSFDEVKQKFYEYYDFSTFPSVIPETSSNNELPVYRITIPYKDMMHESSSCYSFKPEHLTGLGRANIKNFPVFYGSADIITALSEMKDKLKDKSTYYISKWYINLDKVLLVTFLYNKKTNDSKNPLYELSEHIKTKSKSIFDPNGESIHSLVKDLGNLFSVKGDQYYHITGALSHTILHGSIEELARLPILLYSSVERENKSINVAIPPKVANNIDIFRLESVHQVELTKNEITKNNSVSFAHLKKAIFKDNKFQNWFTGKFALTRIYYDKIEIKLYDENTFKGEEVLNKNIFNGYIPIKEILNERINKRIKKSKLPDDLFFEKSDSLLENGSIKSFIMIVHFDHGIKFPVGKSYSCIKMVQIPVDIELNF